MSRIGKLPISVPGGVEVKIEEGIVRVKGPKGELEQVVDSAMEIKLEDGQLTVARPNDERRMRAFHGLTRTLINNMVVGVTDGFSKTLEIEGIGYKAEQKGKGLLLTVGYSHPIYFVPPSEVKIETPAPTRIVISGINKVLVGQVSAKIRSFRPPEPYKGKGIRYSDEHVRRKAGKTAT